MTKKVKEILIFSLICFIISNPLWYFAYSNQESDYSMFLMMIASFFPMVLTLIVTKISKEGWNNLGIAFNFKKSWKIYLVSMLGTTILPYITELLLIIVFPKNVTTTFILSDLCKIAIFALVGTACFVECLGEELGWIGYLFPRLESVFGTMPACITLGIIRTIWHLGILVLMDFPIHAFFELTLSNIFLQSFMVYMYKKSGSLFPCTISHGISNLLPIFLVYEKSWYYTSILPIIIGLIPTLIYGIYGYFQMKKNGLLVKKTYIH